MRRALHRVLAIGLSVGALGVAGCGGDRSNHTAGPTQRATDVNVYGCMSDELDKWRRCPANPAYNKSPAQREAEESRARVAHQSVPLARDVIAHIKSKTRDAALNNGAYFF